MSVAQLPTSIFYTTATFHLNEVLTLQGDHTNHLDNSATPSSLSIRIIGSQVNILDNPINKN